MYYTYVLQSESDRKLYVGCTRDLKVRFEEHKNGNVTSTRTRRPLKIVYYEACVKRSDAEQRERYLKTAYGKRYLKSRLKSYFMG